MTWRADGWNDNMSAAPRDGRVIVGWYPAVGPNSPAFMEFIAWGAPKGYYEHFCEWRGGRLHRNLLTPTMWREAWDMPE